MNKAINKVLSIILFLCLAHLPHGSNQFGLFAVLISFEILAHSTRSGEIDRYDNLRWPAPLFHTIIKRPIAITV